MTNKSAIAKCMSMASIREGDRRRFLISTVSTFMLPIRENVNRMLKGREGEIVFEVSKLQKTGQVEIGA